MSKLDDFLELARKKGLSEKERMAELKRLGFKLTKEEVAEQLHESEKEVTSEEGETSKVKVIEKRIKGNVIRRRVRKVAKPKVEEEKPAEEVTETPVAKEEGQPESPAAAEDVKAEATETKEEVSQEAVAEETAEVPAEEAPVEELIREALKG